MPSMTCAKIVYLPESSKQDQQTKWHLQGHDAGLLKMYLHFSAAMCNDKTAWHLESPATPLLLMGGFWRDSSPFREGCDLNVMKNWLHQEECQHFFLLYGLAYVGWHCRAIGSARGNPSIESY